MEDIDDVTMVEKNVREFYVGNYIGKVLLKVGQDNVLTNIKVPEDQQGDGFSRVIIQRWLNTCSKKGYDAAYVVNIKSEAIIHVLKTLDNYETKQITNRQVPYEIVSGEFIPDEAFKIEL